MPRRYTPPEGWCVQAFCFALDPSPEQLRAIHRHFGGRRKAHNWAVATMKADLDAFHATGAETPKPSHFGLRKRWNAEKDGVCVNAETGCGWWREVSKEAFSEGIQSAVDGYWRWQKSRAGKLTGCGVGFPRFKKKGRDQDRCTFTTGAMRVESDRRHVTVPRVGTVRTHETTRRVERLIALGRAKVLSITLRRRGDRIVASVRVALARPQQPCVARADSVVGVDVGVRRLATIATPESVIARVENPKALARSLRELRRLNRQRSRRTKGSIRYQQANRRISVLHASVANIRSHHIHQLTTRLAKTHGTVVVEGLDASGMLRQRGLPGARARRRGLSDAALGETKRQLTYKCPWYGSALVVADRFFASSKTCYGCGAVQDIAWSEHWRCARCSTEHQRDDNAAINLARYAGGLGGVAAPVKRGAERKTGPRPAVGEDTRKREPAPAGSDNPERGAA